MAHVDDDGITPALGDQRRAIDEERNAVTMLKTPEGQTTSCPFDHHSPDFRYEFRDRYDRIREEGPILWSDLYGGFWVVTDYATVRKIAQDSETFTVAPGPDRTGGLRIPAPPGLKSRPLFVPGETDGDEHDMYRLALNPHFTRAKVEEITPMILGHVTRTLDRVLSTNQFDAVQELIIPILAGVAADHLGLEAEDPSAVFHDMHRMISTTVADPDEFQALKADFESSWQYIDGLVKERRANPKGDVVSALVTHTDPVFTDQQVEMMVLNVILGAFHTTSSLMSQVILHLDEDPDLRQYIRDNPDKMTKIVDEFLRLKAVSMQLARTATRDVEIKGAQIKKGDRVLIAFAGANYDPEKYPNPTEFDIERGAAQHLAMGVGTHFCLGAWLAKKIVGTTIIELYNQVETLAVDHDGVVLAAEISNAYGIEHLPVTVVMSEE